MSANVPPRIDRFQFGRIVIGGLEYRRDVIIFPDGVQENWTRRHGHLLSLPDLTSVLRKAPETVIIGAGVLNSMKVSPGILRQLKDKGIVGLVLPSGEACEEYNRRCARERTALALHLTC